MKKFIAIIALAMGISVAAMAQPRTVGIRVGNGLDVTYQHYMGENNMITADLALPWTFNGIGATATYDWINPFNANIPWNNYGGWNWYMGAGAHFNLGGTSSKVENIGATAVNSTFYFGVGVAGRVGVEYNFEFPLSLALEYTPVLGPEFGNNTQKVTVPGEGTVTTKSNYAGFGISGLYHIGLAVRYRF